MPRYYLKYLGIIWADQPEEGEYEEEGEEDARPHQQRVLLHVVHAHLHQVIAETETHNLLVEDQNVYVCLVVHKYIIAIRYYGASRVIQYVWRENSF